MKLGDVQLYVSPGLRRGGLTNGNANRGPGCLGLGADLLGVLDIRWAVYLATAVLRLRPRPSGSRSGPLLLSSFPHNFRQAESNRAEEGGTREGYCSLPRSLLWPCLVRCFHRHDPRVACPTLTRLHALPAHRGPSDHDRA